MGVTMPKDRFAKNNATFRVRYHRKLYLGPNPLHKGDMTLPVRESQHKINIEKNAEGRLKAKIFWAWLKNPAHKHRKCREELLNSPQYRNEMTNMEIEDLYFETVYWPDFLVKLQKLEGKYSKPKEGHQGT